jgi:ankyrin repeat protein
VRLLLEKGADINMRGVYNFSKRTALTLAAWHGHEAVVRLLLEKGADVNMKGDLGVTALYCAATCAHVAVVRLLLEKGAETNAKALDGVTALDMAKANARTTDLAKCRRYNAIVQLLKANRPWYSKLLN